MTGDDARGPELAERELTDDEKRDLGRRIADALDPIIALARDDEIDHANSDGDVADWLGTLSRELYRYGWVMDERVLRGLAPLASPALAAPAETEAGDAPRFGSDQERVEIGMYGLARCLVAACNPDTYAHVSEVERATPDDAPWGEVDSLLATHDRLGDEALARRLGIDVEQYADDDLPIGERIDELLAATPPAQSRVEAEGGWLRPASGSPEWVRYAEATQARYAVRSDLGVTHPTDTVRLFEVFNALAVRGYRLVEAATPPAHPTPADDLVAPTIPGLTRAQVIEAVDAVNRDLTDPRPFGEYVADRLGLTEEGDHG